MGRRKDILAAAARLFSHYGLKKTTMADIAEEAGIGTGSVYLEFPSKESIVCGLATREHQLMLSQLEKALAGDGDLADRVVCFFDQRTALFRRACAKGAHAGELLRCTGKTSSPWPAFEQEQQRLLEAAVGEPDLARGLLLAYAGFAPLSPRVHDEDALRAVHALTRRALS